MAQMSGTGRRSIAQTVGLVFGAVYVLVGLVGFAVTAGVDFVATEGDKLLGIFELNPLHNVVHLLIGAALIWGATQGVNAARAVNTAVGASYLLVGLVGLFLTDSDANILAINHADNALHLASAAVLLTAGLLGTDRVVTADSTTSARTRSRTGTR